MKVYESYLILAYVSLSGTEFVIRHEEDMRKADCYETLKWLKKIELWEEFQKQHPVFAEYLTAQSENRPVIKQRKGLF